MWCEKGSVYILRTGMIFRRRAGVLLAAAAGRMPALHTLSFPGGGGGLWKVQIMLARSIIRKFILSQVHILICLKPVLAEIIIHRGLLLNVR